MQSLKSEGIPSESLTSQILLQRFQQQVKQSIEQLKITAVADLTSVRVVGRAQIPSTVIGLYTHAAEHTMRHIGQLLVTVKILT